MNDEQHAFTDIISNTLGVLILITLLSIMLHGKLSEKIIESDRADHVTQDFQAPRKNLSLPTSSYYIAISDRIVQWKVDEIADWLLKNPDENVGRISTGEFVFIDNAGYEGFATIIRDVDSYFLYFTPDNTAIKAAYPILSNNNIEGLIDSINSDYADHNIVPLFFVYPSGMTAFEAIHRKMHEMRIRMRWRPAAKGNDIFIYRSIEQFQDFYIKR